MASIVRNPITNKFDVVSETGAVLSSFNDMSAAMRRRDVVNQPRNVQGTNQFQGQQTPTGRANGVLRNSQSIRF